MREYSPLVDLMGNIMSDAKAVSCMLDGVIVATSEGATVACDAALWEGAPLASLGVRERWNNAVEKFYSRDRGGSEDIELVRILR